MGTGQPPSAKTVVVAPMNNEVAMSIRAIFFFIFPPFISRLDGARRWRPPTYFLGNPIKSAFNIDPDKPKRWTKSAFRGSPRLEPAIRP